MSHAPQTRSIPAAYVTLAQGILAGARQGTEWAAGKVYLSTCGLDLTDAETLLQLDELRRMGALRLCRADLVCLMDADLVAASEVVLSGAQFHFLCLA